MAPGFEKRTGREHKLIRRHEPVGRRELIGEPETIRHRNAGDVRSEHQEPPAGQRQAVARPVVDLDPVGIPASIGVKGQGTVNRKDLVDNNLGRRRPRRWRRWRRVGALQVPTKCRPQNPARAHQIGQSIAVEIAGRQQLRRGHVGRQERRILPRAIPQQNAHARSRRASRGQIDIPVPIEIGGHRRIGLQAGNGDGAGRLSECQPRAAEIQLHSTIAH